MADIAKMQICESQTVQGVHLATKLTSAASLPTVAVSLSYTEEPVPLVSAGP